MRILSWQSRFTVVFAYSILFLFATRAFSQNPTEQILYSFPDAGGGPDGGLVADSAGNLYGTTQGGGLGFGTVFEISPPAAGGSSWTETTIHEFNPSVTRDGATPRGTLIFDKAGNLYGTSQFSHNGDGAVFELSPPATSGGNWTSKLIMNFPIAGGEGTQPEGRLVFDENGNLYGTTTKGGTSKKCGGGGCGTVFELSPPAAGRNGWTETLIHSFGTGSDDGIVPGSGLLIREGILYGTTTAGGADGNGIVFQLKRVAGAWQETILHSFATAEGSYLWGSMTIDAAGNLYGTANQGGEGYGTIFELSPPAVAADPWQENTIYSFTGAADGGMPTGGLIRDETGNLYGTAELGGFRGGVVYKLIAPTSPGDAWTEVVLHVFDPAMHDGEESLAELLLISGNGLFGTTWAGGSTFGGTVFNLTF